MEKNQFSVYGDNLCCPNCRKMLKIVYTLPLDEDEDMSDYPIFFDEIKLKEEDEDGVKDN